MRRINVSAGKPYDVLIGAGLLDSIGTLASEAVKPCRAAVISDSNVAPLYLGRVLASLSAAGFVCSDYIFAAGEGSKNIDVLSDILEHLAAGGLTRSDCVFALGGGVVGDMAGFAAACYMRGISCVQIPTSLLAAVDSSVGGKTAINLRMGKNLAGAFHQPSLVVCDTDILSSLPPYWFSDGTAEIIKTAVLCGGDMLDTLSAGGWRGSAEGSENIDIEDIIGRCVSYKASVVAADESERGCRRLLNLGHTPAHAIELLSGYTVPHGHAVAAGLGIISRAAVGLGLCERSLCAEICAALRENDLPTGCDYPASALAEVILLDKKRCGDSITMIMPYGLGLCADYQVNINDIELIMGIGTEEL